MHLKSLTNNKIVFHAVILSAFATWPFVSYIANNIDKGVIIHELAFVYISYLVIVNLLYLASTKIISLSNINIHPLKTLSIFILLSTSFFFFGIIPKILFVFSYTTHLSVWVFCCVVLSMMLYKIEHNDFAYKIYTVLLAALLVMPAFNLAKAVYYSAVQDVELSKLKPEPEPEPIRGNKPNVYFIVLDGYGRSDVLKRLHNYDNSRFTSYLRKKGFYVASKNFSNYGHTFLSLPSTLSMKYLLPEGPDGIKSIKPFIPLLGGDNATAAYFKSQGYRYIHTYSKYWDGTRCTSKKIDHCLHPQGVTVISSETVHNLILLTPLHPVLRSNALARKEREKAWEIHQIPYLSKQLETLIPQDDDDRPLFLFAHMLAPHPPNRYGTDCVTLEKDDNIRNWKPGPYRTQVKCTDRDVLRLLDTIFRLDKSNPIIIVQADHGPDTRLSYRKTLAQWERDDVLDRFGTLNALYLPRRCRSQLYDRISNVNTFRVVISCLTGKPVPLLEDKSFYAIHIPSHKDNGLVRQIIKNGRILVPIKKP